MKVRFAVYNLLKQQRVLQVDEELEFASGFINAQHRPADGCASPRCAQLTASVEF
jgi:hypothetical protein